MTSQSDRRGYFEKAKVGIRIVTFISLAFVLNSYVYNLGQLTQMTIGDAVFNFAVMFSSLLFPILIRNLFANLIVCFFSIQISYADLSFWRRFFRHARVSPRCAV